MMKKIPLLFLAGLFVAWGTPVFAVDSKIGVVNTMRLLENAPQAEAASASLEKEFAPRKQRILAQQKELKQLEDKLARDSAVMSEDGQHKMERDLLAKRREIKRSQEEYREDLNIRRNEVLAGVQRDVMASIKSLAKSENYDLILYEGVAFASDGVDITDRVLQYLNDSFKGGTKK